MQLIFSLCGSLRNGLVLPTYTRAFAISSLAELQTLVYSIIEFPINAMESSSSRELNRIITSM